MVLVIQAPPLLAQSTENQRVLMAPTNSTPRPAPLALLSEQRDQALGNCHYTRTTHDQDLMVPIHATSMRFQQKRLDMFHLS